MKTFRLTFVRNEVLSCEEMRENLIIDGPFHYVHQQGKLIYALVKAEKEENALTIADHIVKEVRTNVFGNDYTH